MTGLLPGFVLASTPTPMDGGGLLIFAVLLGLVVLGVPLFVIVCGLAVSCFIAFPEFEGMFTSLEGLTRNFNLIEPMVALAEQPTMVAIPFFMVAGAIMSRGSIAERLVDFANALFGWLPGGLALSTIAACMLFAAISGSSPVTVITIGAIMLPALAAAGYDEKLGVGLVTSAGSLGIIIPPSIPMIVYGIFATSVGEVVNIEELFIAGLGPGIVIALLLAGYCVVKGKGVQREPFEASRVLETFLDGLWSLSLPGFILGGIYLGVFNATEASAISVVLALLIELVIHRSLSPDELPGILGETSVLLGSILVIVCVAFGFSEFMTMKEVPDAIITWLSGYELGPIAFILLLNVLLLVVGCLLDIISAIILFVPLVAPIAGQLGFEPIHVALIFIVNLEIGYLTPPLGLNLFVATTYFNKPFGMVIRSVAPFLVLLLVGLGLVTYVPTISMGILNAREGKPLWSEFPSGKVLQPIVEEDEDEDLDDEVIDEDDDGEAEDEGAGDTSIKDLMNDPEYRKLIEEQGEDEDEDEDEGEDDAPLGDVPIKDLMDDPEYRKLIEEQ